MALLHYANLEDHRPDVLMKLAFFGLTPFYQFLRRTKAYQDSEDAVRRVGWEVCGSRKRQRGASETNGGVWIRLVERTRGTNAEGDLRAFMDDGNEHVYEADPLGSADVRSRVDFDHERRVSILDRDPGEQRLKLERMPKSGRSELVIRTNTWPTHCQLQAIERLQNAPLSTHRPLLRLFEATDHAHWTDVHPTEIEESGWMILTEAGRAGTDEQRRFVETALATPDFAFLEGPPGSGKTTAICELILQLVKLEKRVLLCASTHVAVDNVLERLMDDNGGYQGLVIPVRIGDESKVSETAKKWRLSQFAKTELKRLRGAYRKLDSPSPSQQAMGDALGGDGQGQSVIERAILDASNLVCGTSIGILQHPDLKPQTTTRRTSAADANRRHSMRPFDVLIVDEASKTTFQEFLVPALQAKRWIIVGDPKQLSPYVDEDEMAVNLRACLPDETTRNACVDAFTAAFPPGRRRGAVVVAGDDRARAVYAAQCEARNAKIADVRHANGELAYADIVVGETNEIERRVRELPLDAATLRGAAGKLVVLQRRIRAWRTLANWDGEPPRWENEVAWRLGRLYDLRFAKDRESERASSRERLNREVEDLLPADGVATDGCDARRSIASVSQVALPSVLESMRHGFAGGGANGHRATALSDGLPDRVLNQRRVLLTTQQRMHPEIAAFSREHIYDGEALHTPPFMEFEREWDYPRYRHRSVWIDVRGGFNRRTNSNVAERVTVLEELRLFEDWAKQHPRPGGGPWEAAVLTFYRGQERDIRNHLPRYRREGSDRIRIDVCTVDRFQGHESDIVFISFAKPHSTSFLESPNRLNVALTRARYQRVIVGNRDGLGRSRSDLLRTLVKEEPWNQNLGEEEEK